MPKKYERLVRAIRRNEIRRYGYEKYNPYAVAHSILNKSKHKGGKMAKVRVRGHLMRIGRHRVRVRGHLRRK